MIECIELLDVDAAELVRTGSCSGNCLVATGDGCDCACHGSYHGALAGTVVSQVRFQRHDWIQVVLDGVIERVQVDSVNGNVIEFSDKSGQIYEVTLPPGYPDTPSL